MQRRAQPLIQVLYDDSSPGIGFPAIQVGISDKEGIGIPQGQGEIADHLAHQVAGESAVPARAGWQCTDTSGRHPRRAASSTSQGSTTLPLDFGHLLPFAIQDQAQADDIFKTDLVE